MSTTIVDSEPFGHARRAAPPSYKRALGAPRPERRGEPSAMTMTMTLLYWAGGGATSHDSETRAGFGPFVSSYFGFQLVCGVRKCTQPAQLDIGAISLYVRETSGPSLVAPQVFGRHRDG